MSFTRIVHTPDGVGVALAARVLGIRPSSSLRMAATSTSIPARRGRAQMKWMLSRAGAVIAVSDGLKRKLDALLPRRSAAIRRIPARRRMRARSWRAIGTPPGRSLGITVDSRIALFVGQLVPIERAWTCCCPRGANCWSPAAWSAADRLCLIGEGPLRSTLEQRAAEPCSPAPCNCWAASPVASGDLGFNAADVACLSSRNEGTPNVIIEALASGGLVVATAVGGIPDMMRSASTASSATE